MRRFGLGRTSASRCQRSIMFLRRLLVWSPWWKRRCRSPLSDRAGPRRQQSSLGDRNVVQTRLRATGRFEGAARRQDRSEDSLRRLQVVGRGLDFFDCVVDGREVPPYELAELGEPGFERLMDVGTWNE